ncbi:MAG TPA: hypothetical protein VKT25_11075 [Ktedonobacteraceae bacterium]|nr:hypothetical protein [Ktedonobacteraceae bacterium]
MNLTYPQNPAQGATYADFLAVLERLWYDQRTEPTRIEFNPVDERLIIAWVTTLDSADELEATVISIRALINPITGTEIPFPFDQNEQVGLGIMRFLDDAGMPLALLELYPLAEGATIC